MIQMFLLKHWFPIAATITAIILATGVIAGSYNKGKAHSEAICNAEKAAIAIASNEAIVERLAQNRAIEAGRIIELQKVKESYEKQIYNLGKRPAGGLHIPRPADCPAAAISTGNPNSSGANDTARSIRLPAGVEENLYTLTDKADVIRIRLTALQEACK
jgi:hypothetical protein